MHFSWALLFGNVPLYVVRSLRLPLFLERSSGKSFGLTPGGGVKTLFLYFVSEIRGKCCAFFLFRFCVLGSASFVFFFAVFFPLGLLFGINFRERAFVFCGQWRSCVFRWCFA